MDFLNPCYGQQMVKILSGCDHNNLYRNNKQMPKSLRTYMVNVVRLTKSILTLDYHYIIEPYQELQALFEI